MTISYVASHWSWSTCAATAVLFGFVLLLGVVVLFAVTNPILRALVAIVVGKPLTWVRALAAWTQMRWLNLVAWIQDVWTKAPEHPGWEAIPATLRYMVHRLRVEHGHGPDIPVMADEYLGRPIKTPEVLEPTEILDAPDPYERLAELAPPVNFVIVRTSPKVARRPASRPSRVGRHRQRLALGSAESRESVPG